MTTEDFLLGRFGPLMSIADVAGILGRSADGFRVALYSDGDVSRRLRPTMVRIGRRVYFRTLQLADALGLDGGQENRAALPPVPFVNSECDMGRQRTINDANWRSVKMSGRTVEDRYALLYFLTSPFSNIVGAYELVISIAAPEMGWDSESQLKPVIKRLINEGFLECDQERGFIWVRDWWDHNSAKMAVGPALIKKTIEQIWKIPDQWRPAYLADFLHRLDRNSKEFAALSHEFGYRDEEVMTPTATPADRVHGLCPDPVDRVPTPGSEAVDRSSVNTNGIYNSINTTTTKVIHNHSLPELSAAENSSLDKLLSGIPDKDAQALVDEFCAAVRSPGTIRTTPMQYLAGLVKRYHAGSFAPGAGIHVAQRRSIEQQQLKRQSGIRIPSTVHDAAQPHVPTSKGLEERAKLKTMRAEIAGRRQQGSAL